MTGRSAQAVTKLVAAFFWTVPKPFVVTNKRPGRLFFYVQIVTSG